MVLQTQQYSTLTDHLTVIDEVFTDSLETEVSQAVGMTLFAPKEQKTRNDTVQLNHGLRGVRKIDENQDYPEATGSEGDNITFTKKKYGSDVILTKENQLYDEYDVIEENVRSIVEEGISKIDQSYADIISLGFSTSSYQDAFGESVSFTGPDGKALFDTGHTNGTTSTTYSNVISDTNGNNNPVIGRDPIKQARIDGLKYKDPQGVNRPVRLDTILVPPDLEDEALRAIGSEYLPGSANNDTNAYLYGFYSVVAWDKLATAADGTDTSSRWFMYDSKKVNYTLKSWFSQFPELYPPEEFKPNKNNHFMFDFLFSRGFSWQAYVRGSKGTN